jgi:hypothetical protein
MLSESIRSCEALTAEPKTLAIQRAYLLIRERSRVWSLIASMSAAYCSEASTGG